MHHSDFDKLPLLERLSIDKGECYGCYAKEHEEAIAKIVSLQDENKKLREMLDNLVPNGWK